VPVHFSLFTRSLLLLRIPRRECDPAGAFAIEADLERVLSRPGQRHVEHEHGAGLHIHDACRRLTELDRTLAAEQLSAGVVYEANTNGVRADLSASATNSKNEMSSGIHRREIRQPDMLKHAQHAELALLIYKGVVRDNSKIEVQGSADSNRRDDVVLLDLVHHVHSLGNLAKYRVNFIEMRLRRVRNEELAAAGVFPRVSHG
jgi:hypothetical protein